MKQVKLIADTNVVSYMFKESPLGSEYEELIDSRHVGLTGYSIAELRRGAALAGWGERRLLEQRCFLDQFSHVPDTREMAELCGAIHAARFRSGSPIDWPDAWAAASALWLDVPLVTHDRDLEGIVGLRVLTAHREWWVRETDRDAFEGGPLWMGESPPRSWSQGARDSAHQ
jgi:predicted nucleic acid-binding protein